MTKTKQSHRGLQNLSPERRRQIASLGGRKAHELGLAHQWDSESAAEAGRKGGSRRWHKMQEAEELEPSNESKQ